MIRLTARGSTAKTEQFLKNAIKSTSSIENRIRSVADAGVRALAAATPVDSGATANAWSYEIVKKGDSIHIYWTNSNVVNGVSVAVLIQYGHGTGTGGYVQGRDFINPAIRPIFDQIAENAWKAVTSA